ncbi:MAG: DUF1223 domain-containing protein [Pseudomonadota bacterium]
MYTCFFRAALAIWLALGAAAQADSPVVVELYTSQGCSACPPADKMLHDLAQREDVIALALHVDYWDYIGWKDEFADPAHGERQRAYAQRAGRRSIFTPQMIIGGVDSVVGPRAMQVADAISQHKSAPAPVNLTLTRSQGTLSIAAPAADKPGPYTVQLVRYTPQRQAKITRGENAGHTLSYANVAEGWTILTEWSGEAPLSLDIPLSGDAPVVVLAQHGTDGPIAGAAQLK